MGNFTDAVFGASLLAFSISLWLYYSAWVLLTPFLPEDHVINSFFLPRIYAALIPVGAAVLLLTLVALFAGFVLLSESKGRAKTDTDKAKAE